ncbi:hypothetical protein JCM17823_08270 [Halorubrum gandharaense]
MEVPGRAVVGKRRATVDRLPPVVVGMDGQPHRGTRVGRGEHLSAPRLREAPGEHGVFGLGDEPKPVAGGREDHVRRWAR